MLTRARFRRIWVVQEIAVSTKITVRCGQRSISWDDFCAIVLLEPRVNDRYGYSLEKQQLFENVIELFLTRCAFFTSCDLQHLLPSWHKSIGNQETRGDYILDMVARSRQLEATDPRDKIFALLGISSGVDLEDPRIAINYSKTIRQVYEDFARYTIDAGRSLDVLSYVRASLANWPNWVPDWRNIMPAPRTILSCVPKHLGGGQGEQRELHEPNYRRSENIGEIRIRGAIIGQLQEVSPVVRLYGRDEFAFEQIRQECGANLDKVRSRILERWRAYPWENGLLRKDAPEHRIAGARSDKLRSRLLGRWKAYAWKNDLLTKDAPEHHNARGQTSRSKNLNPAWDEWSIYGDTSFSRRNRGRFGPFVVAKLALDRDNYPKEHHQTGLLTGPICTGVYEEASTPSHQSRSRVVLEHLIQRSHQTHVWTDDESMAIATVFDRSSIIDNRRLGVMYTIKPSDTYQPPTFTKEDETRSPRSSSFPQLKWLKTQNLRDRDPYPPLPSESERVRSPTTTTHGESTLVLLPPDATKGDYIVSLAGARVPFVLRLPLPPDSPEFPRGYLVGECLIDDTSVSSLPLLSQLFTLAGPLHPADDADVEFPYIDE